MITCSQVQELDLLPNSQFNQFLHLPNPFHSVLAITDTVEVVSMHP